MTPPPNPEPDGPRLELLAAYVDDELDEAARDTIERWLAAHPEAKEYLRAQQKFSPANWRLWQKLEPRLPTDDTWAAACDAIAARAARTNSEPVRARRWVWAWVGSGIAAAATAATLLLSTRSAPPAPPQVPEVVQTDDPQAGAAVAVLAISTAADVDYLSVPAEAVPRLPVGGPPGGGRLVLASADDVRMETADMTVTTGPGDSPMIYKP